MGVLSWAPGVWLKRRQKLISGLYHSLKCSRTVLPVQRIWTSFSAPSVGAQQLGEVTGKLGEWKGGRLGKLVLQLYPGPG